MRRAFVAVVGIFALALPGAAFAGDGARDGARPARAEGGPIADAWGIADEATERMRTEEPLVAAAQQLDAAISDLPGYTSLALDGPGLVVYWQGQPPPRVLAAVRRLPAGITVRFEPARYSQAELTSAAQRIRRQIEAGRGNGVHSIDVAPDGSGLRLGVDPPAGASATLLAGASLQPTAQQQTAAARTARAAGVAVATTVTVEGRIQPTSRENDFAPWAGGIVVRNDGPSLYRGEQCTGGFGVKSNNDGRTFLVTVSHCGALWDQIDDPTGEYIGSILYREKDQGIVLIRTSVAGEIYVGGPVGYPQSIKKVGAWAKPVLHQAVCSSAAATGNQCGLEVTHVTGVIKCGIEPTGENKCWGPLVGVKRTDGKPVGKPGDSGGPVYSAYGTRVSIQGVILGGNILDTSSLWIVGSDRINQSFDGAGENDFVDLNLNVVVKY